MSIYDTRFFIEHYYSKDDKVLQKTANMIRLDKNKMISAIAVHEIYKLTLERDGREVADHRIRLIEKDFKIISVDSRIAKISAELRHKYRIPMADSIIAATAKATKTVCITDDIHMKQIKEINVQWI